MKAFIPLAVGVVLISATGALAQMGGGGGNTTRPSYDMPRAYDRDSKGNETYQYHSSPDQMGQYRQVSKHKKHRHKASRKKRKNPG
jgi:hypothetical protein